MRVAMVAWFLMTLMVHGKPATASPYYSVTDLGPSSGPWGQNNNYELDHGMVRNSTTGLATPFQITQAPWPKSARRGREFLDVARPCRTELKVIFPVGDLASQCPWLRPRRCTDRHGQGHARRVHRCPLEVQSRRQLHPSDAGKLLSANRHIRSRPSQQRRSGPGLRPGVFDLYDIHQQVYQNLSDLLPPDSGYGGRANYSGPAYLDAKGTSLVGRPGDRRPGRILVEGYSKDEATRGTTCSS